MNGCLACDWYPKLIAAAIPTIKSVLVPINSWEEFGTVLESNRHLFPTFIRFCNASPKDVIEPIFTDNTSSIIETFKSSARTFYMMDSPHGACVMFRELVDIDHEVRCFWNGALRAVSGPLYYIDPQLRQLIESSVLDFFAIYEDKIPYKTCAIDLCINDGFPFIVEINSYDKASAELFDWDHDEQILLSSANPVFKYYPEFQF